MRNIRPHFIVLFFVGALLLQATLLKNYLPWKDLLAFSFYLLLYLGEIKKFKVYFKNEILHFKWRRFLEPGFLQHTLSAIYSALFQTEYGNKGWETTGNVQIACLSNSGGEPVTAKHKSSGATLWNSFECYALLHHHRVAVRMVLLFK